MGSTPQQFVPSTFASPTNTPCQIAQKRGTPKSFPVQTRLHPQPTKRCSYSSLAILLSKFHPNNPCLWYHTTPPPFRPSTWPAPTTHRTPVSPRSAWLAVGALSLGARGGRAGDGALGAELRQHEPGQHARDGVRRRWKEKGKANREGPKLRVGPSRFLGVGGVTVPFKNSLGLLSKDRFQFLLKPKRSKALVCEPPKTPTSTPLTGSHGLQHPRVLGPELLHVVRRALHHGANLAEVHPSHLGTSALLVVTSA